MALLVLGICIVIGAALGSLVGWFLIRIEIGSRVRNR